MSYYITKKVDHSFENVVARVTEELKKEGFGVLTEIDVKEIQNIGCMQSAFGTSGTECGIRDRCITALQCMCV